MSTREELLDRAPLQFLLNGVDAHTLAEGPVCLVEQLRADGLPIDALELWLVLLYRVRDQGLTDERREWLRERMALQVTGHARAGEWAEQLASALQFGATLEGLIALLEKARALWQMVVRLEDVSPDGDL